MDIEAELKATRIKLEDIAGQINDITSQINQLGREKQDLLQEALRLDGEVRLLQRLKEQKKVES